MKMIQNFESHYETMVTSIGCLKSEADHGNYFVVAHANGLVKLYKCRDPQNENKCAYLCDIQAHSRTINALVCHPTKPTFATVSDDTMVNLWYV